MRLIGAQMTVQSKQLDNLNKEFKVLNKTSDMYLVI